MDHRRYWFKAIKEQLVVMVLGDNNGILVYLDVTGFTRLLDYTGFLGSFGLLGSNDFNWLAHEPHVEDDLGSRIPSREINKKNRLIGKID